MKFDVIPNEQTPRIDDLNTTPKEYIEKHKEELLVFLEYAKTRDDAAGLAANQCSIDNIRFMVRAFALRLNKTDWKLIINPIIVEYIGIKDLKVEGCLTWKGKNILAERSRAVEVSYCDMDGNIITGEIYKGFDAQVWQHEINHLNGVEEDVRDKSEIILPPKNYERNAPCPCGSGKKYKKCCYLLI